MTPNHTQILAILQTLAISYPGVPLQAAAWETRREFDGWYSAYRGIQVGIRSGLYPGIALRTHESGITTLWPAPLPVNAEYQPNPPGRPKVEVDIERATKIRERLKSAGKPYGFAQVAREMGIGRETLRRAWQRRG